jgi:hypothetical protein
MSFNRKIISYHPWDKIGYNLHILIANSVWDELVRCIYDNISNEMWRRRKELTQEDLEKIFFSLRNIMLREFEKYDF